MIEVTKGNKYVIELVTRSIGTLLDSTITDTSGIIYKSWSYFRSDERDKSIRPILELTIIKITSSEIDNLRETIELVKSQFINAFGIRSQKTEVQMINDFGTLWVIVKIEFLGTYTGKST